MNINKLNKKVIASLYEIKKNRILINKIKNIYKNLDINNNQFDKELIAEHIRKWTALDTHPFDLWFKVYSFVNGIQEINYIPENIYYNIVEPVLNNKQLAKVYSDKNFYDLFYHDISFPEVLLRNIDGIFYTPDYNRINIDNDNSLNKTLDSEEIIIVKPAVDSGGGENVKQFLYKSNNFISQDGIDLSLLNLMNLYKNNFVIQRYIRQHTFFSQFNPTSVNTVRVLTYRSVRDDRIIPLHVLLRVGRAGSVVDNQAAGGLSCAVGKAGDLNTFAVDKYGNKYKEINKIKLDANLRIPLYKDIIETASRVAQINIHARLLGLDFCITNESKIVLIEINNLNNEINFYQMNTGPLFKEYTDEIIEYCRKSPRSFVIDFEIE